MALYGLQQDFDGPVALSSVFFSALAAQLLDALSNATGAQIESLESDLSQVIRRALKSAHPDAIAVIQGRRCEGPAADAYALGQIGFAHQLAASAANSRIDESFLNALKATKFVVHLEELHKGERTNKQLAQISGQSDENVSRLMKELRKQGITDFRKDGTRVINFLTPVARQIWSSRKEQADEIHDIYVGDLAPQVAKAFDQIRARLPSHMKSAPSFDLTAS